MQQKWIDINFIAQRPTNEQNETIIKMQISSDEDLQPLLCKPNLTLGMLDDFTNTYNALRKSQGTPSFSALSDSIKTQGKEITASILAAAKRIEEKINAANQNNLLLIRIICDDSTLVAVPWELLRSPSSNLCLGADPALILARSSHSIQADKSLNTPMRVQAPVHTIMMPALGSEHAKHLTRGTESIDQQKQLRWSYLTKDAGNLDGFNKKILTFAPIHIFHFHGHAARGSGQRFNIQMPGSPGPETEISAIAERLAMDKKVRLVMLEACNAAGMNSRDDTDIGAINMLTRGIQAVIAFWGSVHASEAREAMIQLYLDFFNQPRIGNIGVAVQSTRLKLLEPFKQVQFPILWLANHQVQLFELESSGLKTPNPALENCPVSIAELNLLDSNFCLILGDRTHGDSSHRDSCIQEIISKQNANAQVPYTPHEEIQAIQFLPNKKVFEEYTDKTINAARNKSTEYSFRSSKIIDSLVNHLRSGIHVSLSIFPVLEHSLAKHITYNAQVRHSAKSDSIYSFIVKDPAAYPATGPLDDKTFMTKYFVCSKYSWAGNNYQWADIDSEFAWPILNELMGDWSSPANRSVPNIDNTTDSTEKSERRYIIIRPYGGVRPHNENQTNQSTHYAKLTESDFWPFVNPQQGILISSDAARLIDRLGRMISIHIRTRALLFVGHNLRSWQDRAFLRWIFGFSFNIANSLALVPASSSEAQLWRSANWLTHLSAGKNINPILYTNESEYADLLQKLKQHIGQTRAATGPSHDR